MRKHFLIFSVFLCFSLSSLSQVDISIDCQDSLGPARYNKVTVKINFGNEKGFARFTQDFPVGINVVSDDIPTGDFSWRDNQLNVVWINLPENRQAVFSYFVFPDRSMNGNIEIGGKVAVVRGGIYKNTYSSPVKPIAIGGLNGILPGEMKTKAGTVIETNTAKVESKPVSFKSLEKTGTVYRVQVSVSSAKISPDELKKKLGIDKNEKITVLKAGNLYKYQAGDCSDPECAKDLLRRLSAKGIKDAFVVAYRGSEQVRAGN
jgi:hypothetical protein